MAKTGRPRIFTVDQQRARHREQTRRGAKASLMAKNDLVQQQPEVYQALMEKHLAQIEDERGPLPYAEVLDAYHAARGAQSRLEDLLRAQAVLTSISGPENDFEVVLKDLDSKIADLQTQGDPS